MADWAAGYILSATQVGKKCVWRFTPQVKGDATVKSSGGNVVISGMVNTNTDKAESVTIPSATVTKPKMVAAPAGLWVLQDSTTGVAEGSPAACPFTVSVA